MMMRGNTGMRNFPGMDLKSVTSRADLADLLGFCAHLARKRSRSSSADSSSRGPERSEGTR